MFLLASPSLGQLHYDHPPLAPYTSPSQTYYVFCCLATKLCPTLLQPHRSSVQGFSKQVYCSGLPFPSPGTLPNSRMEPVSLALAGRFFTTEPPGTYLFFLPDHKAQRKVTTVIVGIGPGIYSCSITTYWMDEWTNKSNGGMDSRTN